MRVFEPLQEIEFIDGERFIGVYVPGLRYTCWDDQAHAPLSAAVDKWLADGKVKIIEETQGTQPAAVGGQGNIE